jgi:hypothetical protein
MQECNDAAYVLTSRGFFRSLQNLSRPIGDAVVKYAGGGSKRYRPLALIIGRGRANVQE